MESETKTQSSLPCSQSSRWPLQTLKYQPPDSIGPLSISFNKESKLVFLYRLLLFCLNWLPFNTICLRCSFANTPEMTCCARRHLLSLYCQRRLIKSLSFTTQASPVLSVSGCMVVKCIDGWGRVRLNTKRESDPRITGSRLHLGGL